MPIRLDRLLLQPMRRNELHIRPTRRQQLLAWLMLSVYVPMVLLSALHVHSLHEYSELVDCNLCETSVHHQGHITASAQHHGECLSCRFTSTQLVVPDDYSQDIDNQCVVKLEFAHSAEPISQILVRPMLRGPPAIL